MNIPPPPQTESLAELREWCNGLWRELQFPQWETIRLIARTEPTTADQTAEGTIYANDAENTVYLHDGTSFKDILAVDTLKDVIVDLATKGLVLKDTQGTPHYWRITVTDLGALVTSDLGTSKP
jgi:hypothetical protein